MSDVPIHFIGFLANVDDSITKLRLHDGLVIEKKSQDQVRPFVERIESYYGFKSTSSLLACNRNGMGEGYFCITKQVATEFEGTSQGGVAIRWGAETRLHEHTGDKLRLLRLFKEGNVVLAHSFLYHVSDTGPKVVTAVREHPIADTTRFTLTPDEVPEAQSFIEAVPLPLPQAPLELAFESFELSFEIYDISLIFLSLMTAMEVLLNPSDRELRYRVSRNTGVLLGQDRSKGEVIFTEMRNLYDKRSKLVHTGDRSVVTREDMLKLRQYVRETIKEAMRSGMSKDELLKTLNSCGFGQRPWRENAT